MQTRRKRQITPPVKLREGNPDDEEVFSVVSVADSSGSSVVAEVQPIRIDRRKRKKCDVAPPRPTKRIQRAGQNANGRKRASAVQLEAALTISDDDSSKAELSVNGEDEEDVILEDVAIPTAGEATDTGLSVQNDDSGGEPESEMEIELEDVDYNQAAETENHENAYAAAYEAAGVDGEQQPVVYHDGKGQPGGISISLNGPKPRVSRGAKKATRVVTPRDRQVRLATHKWTVLSMIAHARWRNELINDDTLRDDLYAMVPNTFLEKLRLIHPKKVPVQSERVRQFEILLKDLTRWWSHKFQLDAVMTTYGALRQPDNDMLAGHFPRVGRRVDGWIVESALEREDRHREERQKRISNAKSKAKAASNGKARKGKRKDEVIAIDTLDTEVKPRHPLSEITLFGTGDSTTPIYLRLAEEAEIITSVDDLRKHVQAMSGSREVNAQLYVAMCRALGIPARLVISIQAPSWSVGAAKIAATTGAVDANAKKAGDLVKRKRVHVEDAKRKKSLQQPYKPLDVMTSDEESFTATASDSYDEGATRAGRSRKRKAPASIAAASSRAGSSVSSPKPSVTTPARASARGGASGGSAKATPPSEKGKGKAKEKDDDYRDEKWRDVDGPLDVKFEPKLRIGKPKALKESEVAGAEPDIAPVDLASPPTMWVEVFSKPWQKWITVDPVRGMVEPLSNRQMEPSPSDKHNRLVYVLAFEEDGFARDVTARYTRTLHSRVSRMRPPPSSRKTLIGDEATDWWSRVVAAVHRPQRLDRDAAEDIELEASASREPMPSSVAAFKEHPVYTLEKHLKRDEVIYPAKQAGMFQGTPVFLRSSVLSCRSARQWYNEGRTVREGEEALKWVKSRGYTLANKRAEEEARQQGLDGLQEGLYALFQTELYRAPPVVDGRVPTNSFGNIDLFVDTMLPPGGAHIPHNGAGKVAKKLGINYAEAIVGFEFRKHRSMPKLKGIVVPEEHADAVTEAYWASEHMQAEREMVRKRDRLFKNWKKLLNAIKIQERVQREYGAEEGGAAPAPEEDAEVVDVEATADEGEREGEEELEAYRDIDQQDEEEEVDTGGGFLLD